MNDTMELVGLEVSFQHGVTGSGLPYEQIISGMTGNRRSSEIISFSFRSPTSAEFSGNVWLDIHVMEVGLLRNQTLQHLLFLNRGSGKFNEKPIKTGAKTRGTETVDIDGDGLIDIVGKSDESEVSVAV